jgi:CRP-like cAMP-binding protein
MFRQEYARLPIFAGFNGDQIRELTLFLKECQFDKDCLIFRQGQPADFLYILLSGEVLIRFKPYDGPPLTVARIEPGGVFGWSAALRRDVYTSGAVTMQNSAAFRIQGTGLLEFRAQYPTTGALLLDRLAGGIAERLRSTHTHVLDLLTRGVETEK